jgi:hypothetical protein
MIDLGRDFKAPRRADKNQWRKVELLAKNGITFESCGPGYRPRTLAEAKMDLAEGRRAGRRRPYLYTDYERFLTKIRWSE